MRTIHCPYNNLIVKVNNKSIEFKGGKALVDDAIAAILLQNPGYTLGSRESMKTAKTILVIRNQGLGDVLFTTVIPKFIKKVNPECRLTFATFPRHFRVVENNPNVDNIIPCHDIPLNDYDYVCSLNNYFESGEMVNLGNVLHRVDMLKRYFEDFKDEIQKFWDNKIFYKVTNEEKKYAKETLRPLKGKKIISIATQASELTRTLPHNNAIIKYLADKGFGVVVLSTGGDNIADHDNILNLSGKTDIGQMGAIVDSSNAVVSPDTGILHMAGALDKNIVTFFNSFPPLTRTQYYTKCFAFTAKGHCAMNRYPCGYAKCPRPCFNYITPEMVYEKLTEMIGRP